MANEYGGVYFDILCNAIRDAETPNPDNYRNVLWHMHNTEFVPTMSLDDNRVQDALVFRSRFIDDTDTPVGIFELMVSLADRIETDTMGGTSDRNRTSDWFWYMIFSLGLIDMTDDQYHERDIDQILRKFIHREYSRNGRGGLFLTSNRSVDLRKEEIWYQAAFYLNEVLRSEGVLES